MGYELRAVICQVPSIQFLRSQLPDAQVVELKQRLALIPVTPGLISALSAGRERDERPFKSVSYLTLALAEVLAKASAIPVAFVDAEYFGGRGTQAAVVWEGGRPILEASVPDDMGPLPPEGGPIDKALRLLGAVAKNGEDEFDSVGLNRFRRTEDWLAIPPFEQLT
jgi:hypothetical protein